MALNRRLKELRLSANPKLTVRAMAELLNISSSAYHAYESDIRSKRKFLPVELTRKIATILADHGIDPDEVMTLAGVGIEEASTPSLSMGEQQLLDGYRALKADQRRLIQHMIHHLTAAS